MTNDSRSNHEAEEKLLLGPNTLSLLGAEDISSIEVLNKWHRGGAETYVTDFLFTNEGCTRHLIAKACIKFGPREAMAEWLTRREIMGNNGVDFPKLFLVDGATIVEEFIPHTFREVYKGADDESRSRLRHGFIDTFKRICGAGFQPMSLHDVRSRGEDVVVVDVGEDIGGHMQIDSCSLDIVVKAEKFLRSMIENV